MPSLSFREWQRQVAKKVSWFLIALAAMQPPALLGAAVPSSVMEGVIRDLCHKEAALLGEASHGDGKTFQFKVELVQRLVTECGFSAFIIESGLYDFLGIQASLRLGQTVDDRRVAAAVGRLWASSREFHSLVPFLVEQAKAGRLVLGGMDDQIHSTASYAQEEMPAKLVSYLPEGRHDGCLAKLRTYVHYSYEEGAPYSPRDKRRLLRCLRQIRDGIAKIGPQDPLHQEHAQMVRSLERLLDRDFSKASDAELFNQRDASMYANLSWLRARLPAKSKIIVWGASIHMAKSLEKIKGLEGRNPLGFYVSKEFGDRAAALGFSAGSGMYAMIGSPIQSLEWAPENSIEGQILKTGVELDYLNASDLHALGEILARPLNYVFRSGTWSDVFDGIVAFREESAPNVLPVNGRSSGLGAVNGSHDWRPDQGRPD